MITVKEYMKKKKPVGTIWTEEEVEIVIRGYGHVVMLEVQKGIQKYIDDQWDITSLDMQ